MFLFTTSAPRDAQPDTPVMQAIRTGAERTGVSFDYLLRTAQRESALDPQARARTSSATGLFQFIEQTWLATLRAEGARHGFGQQAQAIQQGANGRLTVADPAMRDQIMALRRDPAAAATMAGAFTQRNREELSQSLQREPNAGELYVAHVLGARGAVNLLTALRNDPDRPAARDFPDAAAANRPIFFDRAGRARSAREVFAVLTAQHAAHAGPAATAQPAQATDPSAGVARTRTGLMGLFQTDGARSPVSDAVSRFWGQPRARGVELASLEPAQRFFPGAEGQMAPAPAEQTPAAAASRRPCRPSGRPTCGRARNTGVPASRSISMPFSARGARDDHPTLHALGAHRLGR